MNLKKLLAPRTHPTPADAALLLTRLVMGAAFMLHGWPKIQNPTGWLGAGSFAPPHFQALAAASEFCGGLALILGLFTPLAALGIACTMTVAIWMHAIKNGDPFVKSGPGPGASFELPAAYLCLTLLFLTIGPGRFSLDRLIFGRR
jgi:putative oxidoreductase